MGNLDLASTSLCSALLIAFCGDPAGRPPGRERGRRESDLPDIDRKHFFHQDLRRALGILFLMVLLAAGVYVGSRLPTRIIESPSEAHPNRLFLAVSMAVFASIILLLGLAVVDWISTRRYARRLRLAMNQERIEILRETFRRHDSARNGIGGKRPRPDRSDRPWRGVIGWIAHRELAWTGSAGTIWAPAVPNRRGPGDAGGPVGR